MNIKGTILFFLIISFNLTNSQEYQPFKSGEWLKYKISYSGWVKAGEATLSLKEDKFKEFFHVKAIGKTTGPIKWFFKVEDYYQSYFSIKSGLPKKFIRKINEGGYKKNLTIEFDQSTNKAIVNNIKNKSVWFSTECDLIFSIVDKPIPRVGKLTILSKAILSEVFSISRT